MKELIEFKKQFESIGAIIKSFQSSIEVFNEFNKIMNMGNKLYQNCKCKKSENFGCYNALAKAVRELNDSIIKIEDINSIAGVAASLSGESLRKLFFNYEELKKQQKLKKQVRKILGYSKDEFEKVKIDEFEKVKIVCFEEYTTGNGTIWLETLGQNSKISHFLYKKQLKKVKKYFDL